MALIPRLVYFKAVPTGDKLPPLPSGVSVMEAISFPGPAPKPLVVFQYAPKRPASIFDGIFSGPAPAAAASPQEVVQGRVVLQIPLDAMPDMASAPNFASTLSEYSVDEDARLARQLQDQYDREPR